MALKHTGNKNNVTSYFTQRLRIYKAFLYISSHWILDYFADVISGLWIRKLKGKERICLKSELESKFSLMKLTSNDRQGLTQLIAVNISFYLFLSDHLIKTRKELQSLSCQRWKHQRISLSGRWPHENKYLSNL